MERTRKPQARRRNQSKLSLNKSRMDTQVLREEFDSGMEVLEQIKKQRDYLLAQVRLELQSQKELRSKIEYLKKEYKLLRMSFAANNNILKSTKTKREELEADVIVLEEAVRKVKGKKKNLLVTNDFAKLIEVVNLDGKSFQKEKSVLLTCIRDLIVTTEENEFEGFIWRAKFASSDSALGMRLRFDKLSIGQHDLKNIYTPVISELAAKFKKHNLNVQTKTKSENGVITSMDLTFKLPVNSKMKTEGLARI